MRMFKISKKFIIYGLEILVILGFGIIAFMATSENVLAADKYYYPAKDNGAYLRRYVSEDEEGLPYVAYLSPYAADQITKRVKITVTGENFDESSIVRKDGINRSTRFIDSKHLQVYILPDDISENQAEVYLSVYNRDAGEYSNAIAFKIKNSVKASTKKVSSATGYNYGTSTNNYVYNSGNTNTAKTANYTYGSTSKNSGDIFSKISEKSAEINND